MPTRVRNQNSYVDSGSFDGWSRGPVISESRTMTDVIGDYGNEHDLDLLIRKNQWIRVNGPGSGHSVINFVPDYTYYPGYSAGDGGHPSSDECLTRAMAYTNPNRAYIDLPVSIAELADLPKMVKQLGDNLITQAIRSGRKPSIKDTAHAIADGNLAVQFGWLPLISDLNKLLTFQKYADKRFLELRKLDEGKLKRRVRIGERTWSGGSNGPWPVQVFSFGMTTNWEYTHEGEYWAVVTWSLPPGVRLPSSDADLAALASRAVLGLNGPDLKQVWEVIPFSWLVDYFTNIGDVLAAARTGGNTIPVVCSSATVMRRLKTSVKSVGESFSTPGYILADKGMHSEERKTRKVYVNPSPVFSASIPFLSGSQWSILGSLAVRKFLPR